MLKLTSNSTSQVSLADACYAIYTAPQGGQHKVYDFINSQFPDVSWGWCDPCEHLSPIDPADSTCLVCGESHIRPVNQIKKENNHAR